MVKPSWKTVEISKEVHEKIHDVVQKSDQSSSVSEFIESELQRSLSLGKTKRTEKHYS